MFGDGSAMMMALLVFLAAGGAGVRRHGGGRVRGSVKRRAAGIAESTERAPATTRARCAHSSLKARAAADRLHHQALFGGERRAT